MFDSYIFGCIVGGLAFGNIVYEIRKLRLELKIHKAFGIGWLDGADSGSDIAQKLLTNKMEKHEIAKAVDHAYDASLAKMYELVLKRRWTKN